LWLLVVEEEELDLVGEEVLVVLELVLDYQ
jgi:hypothetical protein